MKLKKVLVAVVLLAVILPTTMYAQRTYTAGHSRYTTTVFDDVAIFNAEADTSRAILVGDCQYFSVFYMADNNDSIDIKFLYEQSLDSLAWAWHADSSAAMLIDAVHDTNPGAGADDLGAGTDSAVWLFKSLSIPPSGWVRFIAAGQAANDTSASESTKVNLKLFKQP